MKKKIAVLRGDGIGKEIIPQALKVLEQIATLYGHDFIFEEGDVGGDAWDKHGEHLPRKTLKICEESDAILFGAVGGPIEEYLQPKWLNCERNSILILRQYFNLQRNLRPIKVFMPLKHLASLHSEELAEGIDFMCVRELLGDVYTGEHKIEGKSGTRVATDIMLYDEQSIRDIAISAFEIALGRDKKVCSVDKANALACSRLWREIVTDVGKNYPECSLEHILVDNCALQLIIRPDKFDVLLMPNLFGDILSDEASGLVGSLGLSPSASLNKENFGLFEPISGSAPDIAGKGIANPIGQIMSAALMLIYGFHMEREGHAIYRAVEKALENGCRTKDIATANDLFDPISTEEMGSAIADMVPGPKYLDGCVLPP